MSQKNVILLKGGVSSEREVSLQTGAAVAKALRGEGYDVNEIDVTQQDFDLPDGPPVFICLHGTFGEDGQLQQRLEESGRIFTGSGAAACRLAFDKLLAREAFEKSGIRVAEGGGWYPEMECKLPFVLKPVSDGSSVGVFLVREESERSAAEDAAKAHGSYMVEELITGRELTVGILDGKALPLVEIRPLEGFYDYENKYTTGKSEHLCPAPLDDVTTARVQECALLAHEAVGCEVYSRVDVLLPETGEPVVLEVNTIPGMTALSLLPEAAAAAGISFGALCSRILERSVEVRS
jgi:D-alanine-D-alanine ligase